MFHFASFFVVFAFLLVFVKYLEMTVVINMTSFCNNHLNAEITSILSNYSC